ncbi:MAG: VTT domain-containing protein [bacterium]
MQPPDFANIVAWVISHNYPLIFLGMLIEGPIISTASAFTAGLGYLNIYIVWGLAISGDFVGDIIYYIVGYYQHDRLRLHGHHFGLTPKRLTTLQKLFRTHPWQALAIIKTTPISAGVLLLAGASHMSYRHYLLISFTISVMIESCLTLIGYLAGAGHAYASHLLHYSEYLIFGGIILLILIIYLIKKTSVALTRRLINQ